MGKEGLCIKCLEQMGFVWKWENGEGVDFPTGCVNMQKQRKKMFCLIEFDTMQHCNDCVPLIGGKPFGLGATSHSKLYSGHGLSLCAGSMVQCSVVM